MAYGFPIDILFFNHVSGNEAKDAIEEVREFYTKIQMKTGINEQTNVKQMVERLDESIANVFNQTRRKGSKAGNEALDLQIAEIAKDVSAITTALKDDRNIEQLGGKIVRFLEKLNDTKASVADLNDANDDMKIEVSKLIDQYQAKFEPIQKSLVNGDLPSVVARKQLLEENGKLNNIINVKVPLLRKKRPEETISFNYPIQDDGSTYAEKVRQLYYDSKIAEHEMKSKEKDLKKSLANKLRLTQKVLIATKELKSINMKTQSLDKLIHFLSYSKLINFVQLHIMY